MQFTVVMGQSHRGHDDDNVGARGVAVVESGEDDEAILSLQKDSIAHNLATS